LLETAAGAFLGVRPLGAEAILLESLGTHDEVY